MNIYIAQVIRILRHKWFVIVCGRKVGGIPLRQLLVHDLSKFSPSEFFVYARKHGGKHCFDFEWMQAKCAHELRNPHHPEFWARHDGVHRMPDVFVREMVADWMAVELSYPNAMPFQDWVKKNLPRLPLHEQTRKDLRMVLGEQGIFV
jgi:hypothetical protein